MLIDSHVHLDRAEFNKDREQLLADLQRNGIDKVINAAILFESNYTMREKLEKYPWIYFSTGIHPARMNDWSETEEKRMYEALKKSARLPRCVAIGETGLDYYKGTLYEKQKYWFHKQIELSLDLELPLILHIREAYEDALDILSQYAFPENAGVVHCFSADTEVARKCIDMGFVLGIGGKVTHENESAIQEAVKNVSIEHIILETDSPFVMPSGGSGKLNTPLNLDLIVNKIAELKGIDVKDVEKITYENTVRVFKFEG